MGCDYWVFLHIFIVFCNYISLSAADVTGAAWPHRPGDVFSPLLASAMPTPGVSTPVCAASATASPGQCERAQGSSRPERRCKRSSGGVRSCSGGWLGWGWSPSPARSARSASVSASSSSESSASDVRVSAMPPPPYDDLA